MGRGSAFLAQLQELGAIKEEAMEDQLLRFSVERDRERKGEFWRLEREEGG